jgi:prepilin-type N-terminal cleavage/methylation domain-containing protein
VTLESYKLSQQCRGFTLIEILVVLALLSLIASMLPSGLKNLYAKSDYQLLVQKVVIAARQCTLTAQQQQRSISLGSQACPIPEEVESLALNSESLPLFHADGTASHSAQIIIASAQNRYPQTTIIVIDSLTANVSLQSNE